MTKASIEQSDGNILDPGVWINIKSKDGADLVGRFSGVYKNPCLGWMFYLSYCRPVDGSKPATTVFWSMTEGNGTFEALQTAVQIEKPKMKGGKPIITPLVPPTSTLH